MSTHSVNLLEDKEAFPGRANATAKPNVGSTCPTCTSRSVLILIHRIDRAIEDALKRAEKFLPVEWRLAESQEDTSWDDNNAIAYYKHKHNVRWREDVMAACIGVLEQWPDTEESTEAQWTMFLASCTSILENDFLKERAEKIEYLCSSVSWETCSENPLLEVQPIWEACREAVRRQAVFSKAFEKLQTLLDMKDDSDCQDDLDKEDDENDEDYKDGSDNSETDADEDLADRGDCEDEIRGIKEDLKIWNPDLKGFPPLLRSSLEELLKEKMVKDCEAAEAPDEDMDEGSDSNLKSSPDADLDAAMTTSLKIGSPTSSPAGLEKPTLKRRADEEVTEGPLSKCARLDDTSH